MYVNLPVEYILNITKFWLNKDNNETIIVEQTLNPLRVILNQKYFQYNGKYFKPTKGVTLGLPISSIVAEIYLYFFEDLTIRHWLESGEISYYRRYM